MKKTTGFLVLKVENRRNNLCPTTFKKKICEIIIEKLINNLFFGQQLRRINLGIFFYLMRFVGSLLTRKIPRNKLDGKLLLYTSTTITYLFKDFL
jgi:hypothetical protein